MNFCTKCQSIYSQPGTCNCYARVSPPVMPPQPTPWITPVVPLPYIGDPPPPPTTTTIPIGGLPRGTTVSWTHPRTVVALVPLS